MQELKDAIWLLANNINRLAAASYLNVSIAEGDLTTIKRDMEKVGKLIGKLQEAGSSKRIPLETVTVKWWITLSDVQREQLATRYTPSTNYMRLTDSQIQHIYNIMEL